MHNNELESSDDKMGGTEEDTDDNLHLNVCNYCTLAYPNKKNQFQILSK